jgi:hypothetical protein
MPAQMAASVDSMKEGIESTTVAALHNSSFSSSTHSSSSCYIDILCGINNNSSRRMIVAASAEAGGEDIVSSKLPGEQQQQEYEMPLMGFEEMTLRSQVQRDETDRLIAQMKAEEEEQETELLLRLLDTAGDTASISSSSSFSSTSLFLDEKDADGEKRSAAAAVRNVGTNVCHDDENDDIMVDVDDDHSLARETYVPSGSMSKNFVYDAEEVQKRTVRFLVDDTGSIITTEYAHFSPLQKHEKHKVWYRRKDYKRIRKLHHEQAEQGRKSTFAKEFRRVYEACSSSSKLRELSQKHMHAVSESRYRGSEPAIFFRTLSEERRQIKKKILKTQQQYLSCKEVMTATERMEALGEIARTLTKHSRRLAHVLGSGDAVFARKYCNEKNNTNNTASTGAALSLPSPASVSTRLLLISPTKQIRKLFAKSPIKASKVSVVSKSLSKKTSSRQSPKKKKVAANDVSASSGGGGSSKVATKIKPTTKARSPTRTKRSRVIVDLDAEIADDTETDDNNNNVVNLPFSDLQGLTYAGTSKSMMVEI